MQTLPKGGTDIILNDMKEAFITDTKIGNFAIGQAFRFKPIESITYVIQYFYFNGYWINALCTEYWHGKECGICHVSLEVLQQKSTIRL